MCQCTPSIRTPFCGEGSCRWPERPKQTVKLRTERWHSSEANEEVHYFVAGTQTYVMGFNPALISEADAKRLLSVVADVVEVVDGGGGIQARDGNSR